MSISIFTGLGQDVDRALSLNSEAVANVGRVNLEYYDGHIDLQTALASLKRQYGELTALKAKIAQLATLSDLLTGAAGEG